MCCEWRRDEADGTCDWCGHSYCGRRRSAECEDLRPVGDVAELVGGLAAQVVLGWAIGKLNQVGDGEQAGEDTPF